MNDRERSRQWLIDTHKEMFLTGRCWASGEVLCDLLASFANSAIREALLEMAGKIEKQNVGYIGAARILREAAREETKG